MSISLPTRETIDEIKNQFLQSVTHLRSKIDTNKIIDFWHEWRAPIGVTCGSVVCAFLIVSSYRSVRRRLKRRRLQFLIDEKRKQRETNFDHLHKRLESSASAAVVAKRREIVLLNFNELHKRLQKGSLSASEVLEAYQWRALEAQSQTNCVCEFLSDAPARAAALDAKYSSLSVEAKPPLFGIPISVSEACALSGHDSTYGLVSLIDQPSKDDSVIIKTIKHLGGVPFVITNVSQGLLSMGCSNSIYGLTSNPHDPSRSAGGASGGEAALIAMRGSPLGLGVDSPGGGLRAPAHWCGVCSLKPTSIRLSNIGCNGITSDRSREFHTIGPMGPNVDSLAWFMRTVCSAAGDMWLLDPYTVPLPFDDRLYGDNRPLTIGYYQTDSILTPVPACVRAVDLAKRILESKGHQLVQISLPFDPIDFDPKDMLAAYAAVMMPDSGQSISELLNKNIIHNSMTPFIEFLSKPLLEKKIIAKNTLSKRWSTIYGAFSQTISEQESIWTKIDDYRSKFIRFCTERNLDCILCPALASTALPQNLPEKMFFILWWYTAIYNLLDCPSGVIRCTNVTSGDERALAGDKDEVENDWISKEIRKAAEGTVGLPVGVQCVALPFREEICLRVMKDIESGARV